MWPWGHLAIGYLAYSAYVHVRERRSPRGDAVVALAVGTQFPDAVDKPLAWTLGVLPSGHSLGHSLLFAVPVAAVAVGVARRLGRGYLGAAFAIGYFAHLPGDVVYPVAVGGEPNLGMLLWPVVPAAADGSTPGLVGTVTLVVELYREALARRGRLIAAEFGLLAAVLSVWLYDGAPPLRRTRGGSPPTEEPP